MKSHEQDLREEILDAEYVSKIQEDYTQVELEEKNMALLDFACKVTRTPWEMTENDVEGLRGYGFSDRDILDAAHIIGYFNYSNRVMDCLGIKPEPDDID